MPNLETKSPARTFKDLLNVHDGDNNEGIEAGLKVVQDGEGVASALSLSQTEAKVDGSLTVDDHLDADSIETQGDLTVGGDIYTDNITVSGAADISEISGAISFEDQANFVDDVSIGNDLTVSGEFEAENVAILGDGSTLKTDAAPTADTEIANKKYVDDQVAGGGSATSLSTGTITATTYGITSDGGVDDVVLAEADTNNSGVLGSAKWDEIVANTAHSGGDGSDHADVATNTSHSGGDGSDHADVATNTTHSSGNGSDHADVATNTSHSGGDGSDHADVATNTAKATCDTTNVKSALNASLGGAANIGDASDTVTFPGALEVTGAATLANLTIDTSGPGWLKVNSLKLDGHEISTTDVDGDLFLAPNGNGEVKVDAAITNTNEGSSGAFDMGERESTHRTDVEIYGVHNSWTVEHDERLLKGGFMWNDDGTKFWIPVRITNPTDRWGLYELHCSTAYDMSSRSFHELACVFNDGADYIGHSGCWVTGIEWDSTGDAFYVWFERSGYWGNFTRYAVATPYNIQVSSGSATTYSNQSMPSTANNKCGRGFSVHNTSSNSGYVFYHSAAGNSAAGGSPGGLGGICRLSKTTGEFSTTPDQTISVPDDPGNITGTCYLAVRVYDSGNKIMIAGDDGGGGNDSYGFRTYSLSVPYDLTSTVTAISHDTVPWYHDIAGFNWSPDGDKAYMTGASGTGGSAENWLVQHTLTTEKQHYIDLTDEDTAKVGINLEVEGDLVVSGDITGSQRYVHSFWSHNFVDEINTGEIRMPWADTTEAASSTGRQAFLAPYDMEFVAWNYRYETITNSHSLTFKIYKLDQGDQTADELGSHSFAVGDDNNHETFQVTASEVDNPIVDAGDLIVMTIQADTDPGGSTDHFMTSHWIMDLNSTYTTGNV